MTTTQNNTTTTATMVFSMGLPAAGKSTVAHETFTGYNFIDADEIKASHPEYNPAEAHLLHEWSKEEKERQFMAALSTGSGQWVIDGTGNNAEGLVRRMNLAKSFGFTVKLFYVKCTLQTSLRRAALRERQVPVDVIREKARNIATSFEICSSYADEIQVLDNDTDR